MTETEVREALWQSFLRWMRGQTVGLGDNGKVDYYKHDVQKFCRWAERTRIDD